ncbi:MAG TPA: type IV toxin-antitoxin system AbiEi family antitoxin domain-containing protein [Solirubrobacterales bacterium]|nr:type IV toxin-antitoxin system AbiEi family antitoxin domain-containing protein [Solirubrobacterales bacterium]
MAPSSERPERALERLASRDHGIVSRSEAAAAGLSEKQIDHRIRIGVLLPEFPGVYRLAHRSPNPYAHFLAAVKACGPDAHLAGLSAAWLWELVREVPRPEVNCPRERRLPGLVVRRCRGTMPAATVRHRIPVTTVPETLVAVARSLAEADLARVVHEAQVKHGTTPAQVERALGRWPSAPGSGRLRAILRGDTRILLSRLEDLFLSMLRDGGRELPETNRRVANRYVDSRWPGRLTVELDGYRYHHTRHAWERDRRREREAYARGEQFRRYTYGDVRERPEVILREIDEVLGHLPALPPARGGEAGR